MPREALQDLAAAGHPQAALHACNGTTVLSEPAGPVSLPRAAVGRETVPSRPSSPLCPSSPRAPGLLPPSPGNRVMLGRGWNRPANFRPKARSCQISFLGTDPDCSFIRSCFCITVESTRPKILALRPLQEKRAVRARDQLGSHSQRSASERSQPPWNYLHKQQVKTRLPTSTARSCCRHTHTHTHPKSSRTPTPPPKPWAGDRERC